MRQVHAAATAGKRIQLLHGGAALPLSLSVSISVFLVPCCSHASVRPYQFCPRGPVVNTCLCWESFFAGLELWFLPLWQHNSNCRGLTLPEHSSTHLYLTEISAPALAMLETGYLNQMLKSMETKHPLLPTLPTIPAQNTWPLHALQFMMGSGGVGNYSFIVYIS